MMAACYANSPLTWQSLILDPVEPGNRLKRGNPHQWTDLVAKTVGDMYHSADYERWGNAEEAMQEQGLWYMPASRSIDEQAYLRSKRRRVDKQRRARVAAAGEGLKNLS